MTLGELNTICLLIFNYIVFVMQTLIERTIKSNNVVVYKHGKPTTFQKSKSSSMIQLQYHNNAGEFSLTPDEIHNLNIIIMASLGSVAMMVVFLYWKSYSMFLCTIAIWVYL